MQCDQQKDSKAQSPVTVFDAIVLVGLLFNEMMICAIFSASLGWWNEQLSDDRSFVTALKNILRANVLAMREILTVRPDAGAEGAKA